jgi:predicted metal-dependent hydrolase
VSLDDLAGEPLFRRGLAAYAGGEHFEAHERWETLWRAEGDPARRAFLQGLILVAASMHKLLRMNSPAGAIRLLDRACEKLAGAPEEAAGLAIDSLRADLARARAAIEALAAEGRCDLATALIPRLSPPPAGGPRPRA